MIGRTDNLKTLKKFIAAELYSKDSMSSGRILKQIADDTDMDLENRCWLSWLYGCFYTAPTSLFVFQNFKEPSTFGLGELNSWNEEFGADLFHQRDRIYVKYKLVEMVESYKRVLNGSSQVEFYSQFSHLPPKEGFEKIFEEVKQVKHFGRFTTFL